MWPYALQCRSSVAGTECGSGDGGYHNDEFSQLVALLGHPAENF